MVLHYELEHFVQFLQDWLRLPCFEPFHSSLRVLEVHVVQGATKSFLPYHRLRGPNPCRPIACVDEVFLEFLHQALDGQVASLACHLHLLLHPIGELFVLLLELLLLGPLVPSRF